MRKQDLVGFDYTGAQPYRIARNLRPVDYCNAVVVTNTGNTTVTVNGHILYPGTPGTNNGDAYVFGGHAGEVWKGSINFFFGAGANPELTVDQKFYNDFT